MHTITKTALSAASLLALCASANAQISDYDMSRVVINDVCTLAEADAAPMLSALDTREFTQAVETVRETRAERRADRRDRRAERRARLREQRAERREDRRDRRIERREKRRTQVVFLDFGSENPTFTASVGEDPFGPGSLIDGVRTPGVYSDFEYDREDRRFILDSMRQDYAAFNIRFTLREPTRGDFSVIRIGDNDENPIDLAGGILFGRADAIDFGNDDRSDTAFADASLWQLLAEVEAATPGSTIFTANSGLPGATPEELDESRKIAVRRQSANTGAHELGHILGLRHHDSFGGIGEGLPPARSGDEFWPNRPDLDRLALETLDHLMASGASTGLSLQAPVQFSRFLSERSANKLTFNQKGPTFAERTVERRRGLLPFGKKLVKNTIEEGVNAGRRLEVRNAVVAGSIDEIGEIDAYRLFLNEGDVFSAEVHSFTDDTLAFPEEILAGVQLSLYNVNSRGERELVEINQTTFEPFDPLLLDVEISQSGEYVLEVEVPQFLIFNGGASGFDLGTAEEPNGNTPLRTGLYRLLAYTISTPLSPEERGIGEPEAVAVASNAN